jgi:hypothetical protein
MGKKQKTDQPKLGCSQSAITDLFWAVILTGAGTVGMVQLFTAEMKGYAWIFPMFFGSAMLIGAGLFGPFRLKMLGAVLALPVSFLAMALIRFWNESH